MFLADIYIVCMHENHSERDISVYCNRFDPSEKSVKRYRYRFSLFIHECIDIIKGSRISEGFYFLYHDLCIKFFFILLFI